MRWFKLATITPIACLLITAAIPNFPLNNRAVAQERFQFNLAQANTSIEGNWEWVCCEGKYWGNLYISQAVRAANSLYPVKATSKTQPSNKPTCTPAFTHCDRAACSWAGESISRVR
jgi:hypothetical protein